MAVSPVLSLVTTALLLAVLAWVVITDLRLRRISNRLTYPLMAFGLTAGVLSGGWLGLRSSVLGWLLGAAILLLPCVFGGIGAGDVKLLAAIGALKGPEFVLWVAIYTGFAGGILALAELARVRAVPRILASLAGNRAGSAPMPQAAVMRASIPYGPAIAAGVVLALLWSSGRSSIL